MASVSVSIAGIGLVFSVHLWLGLGVKLGLGFGLGPVSDLIHVCMFVYWVADVNWVSYVFTL